MSHKTHYQSVILSTLLLLGACDEAEPLPTEPPNTTRVIATLYKVRANPGETDVPCYRVRNNNLEVLTRLKGEQLVEAANIEAGLRRYRGDLWLRVYPGFSHRPSCYVNVDHLIPHS